MTARVAAFVDQPSIVGSAPLYGRNMAVEMFFGALARHGQPGTYQLFYSHDDARTFIDNLSPAPGRLFEAAHVDDLFRDAGRFSFRAWHDPDADLASAARLRSALAMRMYPITATPHVLSYDGLLHGWILRMLLAGVQPCDAIICISRSAKTAIANLLAHVGDRLRAAHGGEFPFRGELVLLPYSIDTERFQPRPREEARRDAGWPLDAFVLLWIGRLSAVDKGDLVPLLRVFRNLVQRHPDRHPRLVIGGAGTPAYESELRTTAATLGLSDHVQLLGAVHPGDRARLFAAADVFVSPVDNMQETLGNTPLEALASGLPQIVADWDGYRDMVVDGETGFLIPTYWAAVDDDECRRAGIFESGELRDHHRLAQAVAVDLLAMERALDTLISNDDLRRRFAAASRARALATYAEPVIMRQFDELWSSLDAIAQSLPAPRAEHYATPAYIHDFGHYATTILGDAATVVATRERVALPDPQLDLDSSVLEAIVLAATTPQSLLALDGGSANRRRHVM